MESTSPLPDFLAAYPPWLLVLAATLVVAAGLWLFAKVVKWLLYLLLILVIVGGLGLAVWLMLN